MECSGLGSSASHVLMGLRRTLPDSNTACMLGARVAKRGAKASLSC